MFKKILNLIKKDIEKTPYYEFLLPLVAVLIVAVLGLLIFERINFSDLVLLATFGAVLYYSFETRQLKNATRTANELQLSPFFVLVYNENKNLILKNEGKGMAYNIEIEPIVLGEEIFEFGYLQKWYYCGPNEQRELPITISNSSGSIRKLDHRFNNAKFSHTVFEHGQNHAVKFTVKFNSPLKNNDYQVIIFEVIDFFDNVKIYNFDSCEARKKAKELLEQAEQKVEKIIEK